MSDGSLLLDSNIIVHIFQGRSDIASQLEGRMLYVSVVSRIELFAWPGPDTGRAKWLDAFLAECRIVELTKPIQEITIDIKKRFKLPMADAMIAATAVDLDVPLLTADKDFKRLDSVAKVVLIET
ncbi:MAG: PIN domain-containing protein [Flavobacteriales bacterium]|nr:PIN domain-containing protein [Flavobacteriales bacterium]MCC6938341.1 PIN domain-containing protein [Flavobacteriales bacterium]